MPRTRNPYPAEFRDQLIALARSGRSVDSLAREFEQCVASSLVVSLREVDKSLKVVRKSG